MGERTEQVITLSLPSSMRHVDLLKVIVTEILKETDFTEDIQEQANRAVIEAGINATKHSNTEGPEKQTTFQLIFAEDQFNVAIADDGEDATPEESETERVVRLSLPKFDATCLPTRRCCH